jgi:hypothetical protein
VLLGDLSLRHERALNEAEEMRLGSITTFSPNRRLLRALNALA